MAFAARFAFPGSRSPAFATSIAEAVPRDKYLFDELERPPAAVAGPIHADDDHRRRGRCARRSHKALAGDADPDRHGYPYPHRGPRGSGSGLANASASIPAVSRPASKPPTIPSSRPAWAPTKSRVKCAADVPSSGGRTMPMPSDEGLLDRFVDRLPETRVFKFLASWILVPCGRDGRR